jgi:altronate hydrolase
VLDYGERVRTAGLNLLSAPGNDMVASTALAVSGAQLVLFSTGRGTPFGCPVPTVKIASNSPLAQRKKSWIDFDAGRLLDGMTLEALGRELTDQVLRVASGEQTRGEENGFHDLAIFKQGVTL